MREIRTKTCPRCFICGADGKLLYSQSADVLFDAPGKWSFSTCLNPNCGLIWLNPRPVDEDLPLVYQQYYTHGTESADGGKLPYQLRDFLYGCYGKVTLLPNVLLGLQPSKRRIDHMFLDDQPPGKLLDVGCGDGKYLNQMRALNWEGSGVDFDPAAVAAAKQQYGFDLCCGDLHSAPFSDGTFDAITMKHVIEHVPDPTSFLQKACDLMKPGGRLVVVTPNAASLAHLTFRSSWRGLEPPRHLHVFSVNNLQTCARQAGLTPLYAGSTAANADVIAGASYSIRDNERRIGHQPVVSLSRTVKAMFFQYREHFRLSAHPNCGEEAVLICVKHPKQDLH